VSLPASQTVETLTQLANQIPPRSLDYAYFAARLVVLDHADDVELAPDTRASIELGELDDAPALIHMRSALRLAVTLCVNAGPWIEWKGGDMPTAYHAAVAVRFEDGQIGDGPAKDFNWSRQGMAPGYRIIAYRLMIQETDYERPKPTSWLARLWSLIAGSKAPAP
jgi:hypothetical protein